MTDDKNSKDDNVPLMEKTKGIISDLEIIKQKMEQQVNMLNNNNNNTNNKIHTDSQSNIIQGNKFNTSSKIEALQDENNLAVYRSKLENQVEEQKQLLVEANSINKMFGSYMNMSENYAASAKSEMRSAWLMRVGIFSLMILISVLSYLFLLPLITQNISTGIFVTVVTFIPFAICLGLVIYLLFMERGHSKKGINHKELSLKMSLLGNYLKEIPQEDADLLKVEVSRFLFNSLNINE